MSKVISDPDVLDRLAKVEKKQRDLQNGTTAVRPNPRYTPVADTPPVEVTRWYVDVDFGILWEAGSGTDWEFSEFGFISDHEVTMPFALSGGYTVTGLIELFKRKATVIAVQAAQEGEDTEVMETEPPEDWDAYPSGTDPDMELELAKWHLKRGSKSGDFSEPYQVGMFDNYQGFDAAPGFEGGVNLLNFAAHDPFVVEDFIYANHPDGEAAAHSFNNDLGPTTWHMDLEYAAGVTETPNYIELLPTDHYGTDIGGPGLTDITGTQFDLLTDTGYNTGGHPFYGGYRWWLPMPDAGGEDGEWICTSQIVLAPGIITGDTLASWTRVGTVGLFQYTFHVRRVTTLE